MRCRNQTCNFSFFPPLFSWFPLFLISVLPFKIEKYYTKSLNFCFSSFFCEVTVACLRNQNTSAATTLIHSLNFKVPSFLFFCRDLSPYFMQMYLCRNYYRDTDIIFTLYFCIIDILKKRLSSCKYRCAIW